jgi:hypothetical protein
MREIVSATTSRKRRSKRLPSRRDQNCGRAKIRLATARKMENESGKTRKEQQKKAEGDEPDPRHWWKAAVAASFPT